jgi:hypothetical protein
MQCLRRILNVSRPDKIRNEIIRQRIGVTPVLDYIKKQQLKRFGHVSRSPPNGIIQRALTLRYNGRRDKSRPRRCWIDDIAGTTANTIQQIHHMALSHTPSPLYAVRHLERRKNKQTTNIIRNGNLLRETGMIAISVDIEQR